MSELITDEIVEAALLAWHRNAEGGDDDCDCLEDPDVVDEYRKDIRATLEAAAPMIAARALEEAADDIQEWREEGGGFAGWKSSAWRDWLRERADRLNGGE